MRKECWRREGGRERRVGGRGREGGKKATVLSSAPTGIKVFGVKVFENRPCSR